MDGALLGKVEGGWLGEALPPHIPHVLGHCALTLVLESPKHSAWNSKMGRRAVGWGVGG